MVYLDPSVLQSRGRKAGLITGMHESKPSVQRENGSGVLLEPTQTNSSLGVYACHGDLFAMPFPTKKMRVPPGSRKLAATNKTVTIPKQRTTYQEHFDESLLSVTRQPPRQHVKVDMFGTPVLDRPQSICATSMIGTPSHYGKRLEKYHPNAVRNRLPQSFRSTVTAPPRSNVQRRHSATEDPRRHPMCLEGKSTHIEKCSKDPMNMDDFLIESGCGHHPAFLSRPRPRRIPSADMNLHAKTFVTSYQRFYGDVARKCRPTEVGFTNPGIVADRTRWIHRNLLD